MMRRAAAKVVLLTFAALALTACATQPDVPGADLPGFFWGLLHGWIAPPALIAELFTDYRIYAYPNSGGWYDLGFVLGASSWAGSCPFWRRRPWRRDGPMA